MPQLDFFPPKIEKPDEFYIATRQGYWQRRDGKKVSFPGYEVFDLFICKERGEIFALYEGSTGLQLFFDPPSVLHKPAKTESEFWIRAFAYLQKVLPPNELMNIIKKNPEKMKEVSPRYVPKEKRAIFKFKGGGINVSINPRQFIKNWGDDIFGIPGKPPSLKNALWFIKQRGEEVGFSVTNWLLYYHIKINLEKKYGISWKEKDMRGDIGQGSYGRAFKIGPNLALKITTDELEIRNSAALVGKKHPNLVELYNVFVLPKNIRAGEKTLRVKNMEINFSIPGDIGLIFEEYLPGEPEDHVKQALHDVKPEEVTAYYHNKASYDEFMATVENKIGFEPFPGFFDVIRFLKEKGIYFKDIHGGNVRVGKDGKYKIIDLGYSQSPGAKEPEVLSLEKKSKH